MARGGPSTGVLGLVAVSAFMVLIRLFGDRVVAAFGRANVVRFGGLVAAAGCLVVILGRPLPVLLVGWALVYLGVVMLAVVVTFGSGAFLLGPAIIGALIGGVGIRYAMALPLTQRMVLVTLSRGLSRSEVRLGKSRGHGRMEDGPCSWPSPSCRES